MLGEAFWEFLVLWVVILSQCLELLPFATWAGLVGLVGLCHCVATQVPVLQGGVRGHLPG